MPQRGETRERDRTLALERNGTAEGPLGFAVARQPSEHDSVDLMQRRGVVATLVRQGLLRAEQGEIERAEPVYETLPGWDEDITGCRTFESLPHNARAYVERVAALAGVPVEIISIGPGRDETSARIDPFRPV